MSSVPLHDGDEAVSEAAAALEAGICETKRLRNLVASAAAAIATVAKTQGDETNALAAAAVKDLRPSDLDEVRAIRASPPPNVQIVVCAVCTCSPPTLATAPR